MKSLYFSLFFTIIQGLTAQNFEIKGKVLDQEGRPLESATVYVEKLTDSSVVSYTVTETDGNFTLTGRTDAKRVNLFVSFAGFTPYTKLIEVKDKKQLEDISLTTITENLDEVIIKAERAPITIKRIPWNLMQIHLPPGLTLTSKS